MASIPKTIFLLCVVFPATVISVYKWTVDRCPDHGRERVLRAIEVCSSVEQYHCLFDDDFQLVEICQSFKQLPPGNYPRYSSFGDDVYYDPCPPGKYQLWPAKSFEITECLFRKSICSSEGQILCSDGTTTSDATCKCDFKKGYVMDRDQCCSPSDEKECTCYKTECLYADQELNSDYICVNKCSSGFERTEDGCMIIQDLNSTTSPTTKRILQENSFNQVESWLATIKHVKWIVLGFCIVVLVLCCSSWYYIFSRSSRPVRKTVDQRYHIKVYQLLKYAADGDIDGVKGLKSEGYIDLDDVDYDQRSALHLAASEGKVEIVKYLLKHKAGHLKAVDRWNNTAVDDAERHKGMLKDEDERKKDYDCILQIFEYQNKGESDIESFRDHIASIIIKAAHRGNMKKLEKYLELNTDMELSNTSGQTALQAAVEKDQTEIIKFLLETSKVSPFVKWKSKRPTVDLLVAKRKEILENSDCIEEPPAVESEDEKIFLLLQSASRGDIRKIRGFRKENYNMNCADYDGRTTLHAAVSESQEHIVKFLLEECNVDIHLRDRWGRRALDEAIDEEKRDILQLFRNKYKDIADTLSNDYKTFQLLQAGKNGDKDKLERLYKRGFDMDMRDYDGRTALHLAASEGNLEAVKYLVNKCNVKTDIPDRGGRKPYAEAGKKYNSDNYHQYEDIMKILSNDNNQQKPESKKERSEINPIYEVNAAAEKGDNEKLRRMGVVYMDAGDYLKQTPLHVSAAKGKLEVVKYLVEEQKVSLFVRNSFWETPIRMARRKRRHWRERLKDREKSFTREDSRWDDYGSDLQSDPEDNIGESCTKENRDIWEQFDKFKKVERYLLQKMRSQIDDEKIEFDHSLSNYHEKELTFLFLNKAFRGDIAAVKRYAITEPSVVNDVDYDDRTALHLAVSEGHYHLVDYLLKYQKVKADKKDRWGNTPLMDAEHNKDSRMISIIKRYCDT